MDTTVSEQVKEIGISMGELLVKGFIESINGYSRRKVVTNLELILCVLNTYNHAQDMEQLCGLYENFYSEYYLKYDPEARDVYQLMLKVCKTTYNSIYKYHILTHKEYQDSAYHALEVAKLFPDIVNHNKHYKALITH